MTRHRVTTTLLLGTFLLVATAVVLAASGEAETTVRVAAAQPTEPESSVASDRTSSPVPAPLPPSLPQSSATGEPAGSEGAEPLRDPTQPGEELRDLVAPIRMGQTGGKGAAGGIDFPDIQLKGRIVGPTKAPGAIVEIDEQYYILEEGSEVTVSAPNVGLGTVTLNVTELTALEVRIEVMPLRQAIVLR